MLWELFKSLSKLCPIYKEIMDEDEDSIPDNYVILQEYSSDNNFMSADGISAIRERNFNIRMYFKTKSSMFTIVKAYRRILIKNNISFTQFGPFFDPSCNQLVVNISGNYIYGLE